MNRSLSRAVRLPLAWAAPLVVLPGVCACSFDRGDRWTQAEPEPIECATGTVSCLATAVVECVDRGAGVVEFETREECAASGRVCAPTLAACTTCIPGQVRCEGMNVETCDSDGSGYSVAQTCEGEGTACRDGLCTNLCAKAADERSNVGCEYWAADLDNANIDESLNAAAQQFAVVLSNPQLDLPATITIEQDDTLPGSPGQPTTIARATVLPMSLQIFRLGPREVDGSPPGEFNTGTHTALTRAAYRIESDVPVVAYQFNPLENVNVFSNDASLLKPVEALTFTPGDLEPAYVVLGWPQTIASTDDPRTNFDPGNPTDLRAFLTIIGTRSGTTVRVQTTARVLGGGAIAAVEAGGTTEILLDAFDVANLETDAFNADFTGSIIEADQPIVVFSGSEASDAPFFESLAERRCCADHLEEQLDPIRTAGKRFIAAVSPNRSSAIMAAGGDVGAAESPEFFRVVAVTDAGAVVRTTLEDASTITLDHRGAFADITAQQDFYVESDEPITLGSVSASSEAAGVAPNSPGGDPSLLIIPPIEQFRTRYVFLTPDRYSFDFVRLLVPPDTTVRFDDRPLSELACETVALDDFDDSTDGYAVYRCQLSFPIIDTSLGAEQPLLPGDQNDGVHDIVATRPVGVLVDGFDRHVSYAYAAGTELTEIVLR